MKSIWTHERNKIIKIIKFLNWTFQIYIESIYVCMFPCIPTTRIGKKHPSWLHVRMGVTIGHVLLLYPRHIRISFSNWHSYHRFNTLENNIPMCASLWESNSWKALATFVMYIDDPKIRTTIYLIKHKYNVFKRFQNIRPTLKIKSGMISMTYNLKWRWDYMYGLQ